MALRARLGWLVFGALVNLYLAAALFGFALRLYPWCTGWPVLRWRQIPLPERRTRKGVVVFGASCVNSSRAIFPPEVKSGLKRTRYCT